MSDIQEKAAEAELSPLKRKKPDQGGAESLQEFVDREYALIVAKLKETEKVVKQTWDGPKQRAHPKEAPHAQQEIDKHELRVQGVEMAQNAMAQQYTEEAEEKDKVIKELRLAIEKQGLQFAAMKDQVAQKESEALKAVERAAELDRKIQVEKETARLAVDDLNYKLKQKENEALEAGERASEEKAKSREESEAVVRDLKLELERSLAENRKVQEQISAAERANKEAAERVESETVVKKLQMELAAGLAEVKEQFEEASKRKIAYSSQEQKRIKDSWRASFEELSISCVEEGLLGTSPNQDLDLALRAMRPVLVPRLQAVLPGRVDAYLVSFWAALEDSPA